MMNDKVRLLTLVLAFLVVGCATNPVTGEKELSLVSEQQELAIGAQQYAPLRQSQGGDYVADPAVNAYINEVGQKLAAVSDRKLPYEFHVLNNSVPNAWALPGGKISVNRGLLTALKSEAELAAVLGHEIVHAAAKHGARAMSKGMLMQGAVVGTAIVAQGKDYADLAQMGAGIGAQLMTTKYGRDAERESDYYGMSYMSRAGYHPQGAVDLQKTFVAMSAGNKQDWLQGMFVSHPASEERVQNNKKRLSELPNTGEMGAATYQAKIRHLLAVAPAYEAYEKGREAIAKKDTKAALKFANKAITLEPKEGHFYALLGDVSLFNKQAEQANVQYNKAIQLNPDFFYYYLQRGQAKLALNQMTSAQQDLEKSVGLLPTGNAYFALGKIARKSGRLDDAKKYYAKVAGNQNKLAKSAYIALLELDLKDNPSAYIKVALGKDKQGNLVAQIENPTPVNITGLKLGLKLQSQAGQQYIKQGVSGVIQAETKQLITLNLGNQRQVEFTNLEAVIESAAIAPK
ncbi:MAG: M48 family metalloprotease [Ghiorsea sp.]